LCRPHSISLDYPLHLALARSAPPELIARIIGAEHALSSFFGAIFNAKMDYFTKTGSGQTSKKHSKRDAFFPVESFPDAIHQKNLVGGAKNTPPLFEQIYT
jgi:hypothetical protein